MYVSCVTDRFNRAVAQCSLVRALLFSVSVSLSTNWIKQLDPCALHADSIIHLLHAICPLFYQGPCLAFHPSPAHSSTNLKYSSFHVSEFFLVVFFKCYYFLYYYLPCIWLCLAFVLVVVPHRWCTFTKDTCVSCKPFFLTLFLSRKKNPFSYFLC